MAGRYEMDMTRGPLAPMILRFALPLMVSNVMQLLYNTVNIVVVGRASVHGSEAQAAVGATSSLINLLINLFIGLAVGASIVVSQQYGAGKHKDLKETLHTCVAVALISGAGLGAFGAVSARRLLIWMNTPADVLGPATAYMRIFFAGMPANLLYNFCAGILRSVGDTRRPLYILMATSVVNVGLNLWFVLGLHMLVEGVAWATVIAQYLSTGLVVLLMVRSGGATKIEAREIKVRADKLRAIVRYGIPAGVQGMMFSISNVLIQVAINSFGEDAVTASTVSGNIEGFVYVLMNAFYQAAVSITAQNYGARDARRVRSTLWLSLAMVSAVGIVLGQAAVLMGEPLARIYNKNPAVIAAACERLTIVAGPYVICGIMEVLVGSLRGIGYSLAPMLVSVLGACVLRIGWIQTIFAARHTLPILYLSYPVSWAATALVLAACLAYGFRRMKRRFAAAPR